MGDRGKGVMLPAECTVDCRVTASKRRGTKPEVAATPRRREAQVMVSSLSKAGPIVSEDSEREMSREIEARFEEYLRDEEHGLHSGDDDDEDDGEQEYDALFIQNQASESPFSKRVTRDENGRYIRCGDSTSSTGMKKTKTDLSWRLKGAVNGGPSHFNVLRSFGGHVAFSSWSNPENLRGWIKCYERPGCLVQMNGIQLSDTVSRRVSESGIRHLSRCMTTNLDDNLISAFVERWQPDTNTFHMPFGEISIMLHDVYHILGIRVDGRKVFVNGQAEEEDEEESFRREDECLKTRVATFLAIDIEDVVPPIYKGGGLLTQKLRTVVETGNEHDSLRAYLLMLLGQTLFVDKSGDRVIARILVLLEDLSVVSEYAWGAATLAYLYRQLGTASRAGYYVKDRPLVQAWSHVPRFKGDPTLLEQHRQRLDGLRAEHVAWTPYGFRPDRECRTTLYSGLIRLLDVVEPYQPDRCLRQFGYCQTIPMHMLTPAIDHRPANLHKSGYRVDFGPCSDDKWGFTEARIKLSERSRPAVMPFQTILRYKIWFERISYQYFYPPTHRVEFDRVGPIWEEPEVAHAVARKFSVIYKQPTLEAKRHYVGHLVGEMEDFFTDAADDDDTGDKGNRGM
ncbi:hypothetical protein RND81_04G043900 [Saponaria officinalis]|uniref:Aminotransferase-like plant mobile domain-containing protein n=1 Tax=Saponaria officinalis TaxID=3572 RepID=A0AAW1LCJ5_SAPOF